MLVYEFRVPLPISVEEYQVAQLWSVAEASKNETGGGEGIEVLENRPFEEGEMKGDMLENMKGQYTLKIYHLESRVPRFIRTLAPKGSLHFREEAWNAYPYCKTVVTNPDYMKDGFVVKIETWHKPDLGSIENVHNLPEKEWKKVHKVKIDIANDHVSSGDYKEEFDPTKFKSEKNGRGPLSKNWISEIEDSLKEQCNGEGSSNPPRPYMCAYKLVTCNFKWWGIQGRVESMIQRQERRLFTTFHRQLFCWMDQWYGLTMNDIRSIEDKTKVDLDSMRINNKEKRGMQVEED